MMWAAVHQRWVAPAIARWFARRPAWVPFAPAVSAVAVSAGAYVTDYYLIPKRFTPGYEMRLSGRAMALIFGALALGLAGGTLLERKPA
jgi:hypothetical protein